MLTFPFEVGQRYVTVSLAFGYAVGEFTGTREDGGLCFRDVSYDNGECKADVLVIDPRGLAAAEPWRQLIDLDNYSDLSLLSEIAPDGFDVDADQLDMIDEVDGEKLVTER